MIHRRNMLFFMLMVKSKNTLLNKETGIPIQFMLDKTSDYFKKYATTTSLLQLILVRPDTVPVGMCIL
jgi:hypothetical protein